MRTRIAVGLVAAFAAGMPLVPMSAKAACRIKLIYFVPVNARSFGLESGKEERRAAAMTAAATCGHSA